MDRIDALHVESEVLGSTSGSWLVGERFEIAVPDFESSCLVTSELVLRQAVRECPRDGLDSIACFKSRVLT